MKQGTLGSPDYESPLPSGEHDNVWETSPVGIPSSWPVCLQAHAQTAASLFYPAAIFWGEQLTLLANTAWFNAAAKDVPQGQAQESHLAADAWQAVQGALQGAEPRKIESKRFLTTGKAHTVLISPLFGDGGGGEEALGVLAQLLPGLEPNVEQPSVEGHCGDGPHRRPSDERVPPGEHTLDMSKLGETGDTVALDQHPFFRRFAEMLPSGLAILDPKANAIFVNQQFYDLTTHQSDDQAFKAWPHSIHPEDYDRVMDAYQDAFNKQKQLRTEVCVSVFVLFRMYN